MKLKVIDQSILRQAIESEFRVEMYKLQLAYVATTNDLYKETNSYPGDFRVTKGGGETTIMVETKLINRVDGSHIFQEHGTGEYMPSWWSPSMTEDVLRGLGSEPRTIPRPGKRIGGRGAPWVDYGGNKRQGWNSIVFYKDNRRTTAESVKGNPPKHKLRDETAKFLTTQKLRQVAVSTLKNAFRKAASQKRTIIR